MRPLALLFLLLCGSASATPPINVAPQARMSAGRGPLLVRIAGGAETLSRAGFAARKLSANVAAVELPSPAALPRLLAQPGMVAVDGSRRLRPLLDQSAPLTQAPAARMEFGLDGRGVLVAIIDSGIDLRHGDFRRADGRTRVRWLLDAAAPRGGLHPELPDYGAMAVYSAVDIDAVLAAEEKGQPPPLALTQRDLSGHGTHVAGIAAGSGRQTGRGLPPGRYLGLAPAADLCIVQASADGEFADEALLIGARFCLDRARDAAMPIVVNVSLGGLGGPHDGTTVLEQALDELFPETAPGQALVVAAGNSGSRDWHSGGSLQGGRREIGVRIAPTGGSKKKGTSQISVEVYFDGDVSVSLVSPLGVEVGPVATSGSAVGEAEDEGLVRIESSGLTAGKKSTAVVLSGLSDKAPAAGDWRLLLSGTARRYDVWFADGTEDLALRLLSSLDADGQISLPATARSAISVGSFTSRTEWPRVDGVVSRRAREERLQPSLFSAAGPTADGRFAPDLSAPGEFIVSSLSQTVPPSDPRSSFHFPEDPPYLIADDGFHGVLRGTSQAAPHVTGAVALLFQRDPKITSARLRELLRTTVEGPGYGPRQGFGRLDVLRAARVLAGARPGTLSSAQSQAGVNRDLVPPGDEVVVTAVPRDAAGLPLGPGLGVIFATTAGAFLGPVRDLGGGRYERTLVAGERGAVAVVTASLSGVPLGRRLQVAFAGGRDELGEKKPAGCTAARSAPPTGFGLLLLLGLPFVITRVRPQGHPDNLLAPRRVSIVRPKMKKNVVLSVAGMLLCLALFACTRNIGDGCVQNVDCSAAGDRFCDIASPGGYCTVEGCDYNTCPDGAACVRFYTLLRGEPACPAGCRPGDRGCCRPDEQCLCGGKGCYCASETSERRWCMRTCDGEGQGSCREGYQCAKTRESGAIPVPRPGVPMPDDIRFCAPAPQS